MTTKFKFPPKTFRDVTKQKPDVLKVINANAPKDAITKIYECKDTAIIHSKDSNSNYASISHAKGYDFIKEWEIKYCIDHILIEDYENVRMKVSSNGVIHLFTNRKTAIVN